MPRGAPREEDGRRVAAVLVPVFRDDGGELRLLLAVRGAAGIHGSQLSLPGGKPEPGDGSLEETALREAHEEVGIDPARVEVVEALPPVDTRTTGFRVYPFLARIPPYRPWQRPDGGEIVGTLTPSVRELAASAARSRSTVAFGETQVEVQGVWLGDYFLWGLTLRILDRHLPRLVRCAEPPVSRRAR